MVGWRINGVSIYFMDPCRRYHAARRICGGAEGRDPRSVRSQPEGATLRSLQPTIVLWWQRPSTKRTLGPRITKNQREQHYNGDARSSIRSPSTS